MLPPIDTRLRLHVLIHRHEHAKPSSTGKLVARAVKAAVCHVYQRQTRSHAAAGLPDDIDDRDREIWILHPHGEPLPATADGQPRPRVVLLDGTWRQAGEMLRACEGVGRRVRLPDSVAASSRYWLRDQPAPGHLSTAEAAMGVFTATGDAEAERLLRLHFELHVYATLLARGCREMAQRYLGDSPLLHDASDVLEQFHTRHRR